jgi:hypothetical protein
VEDAPDRAAIVPPRERQRAARLVRGQPLGLPCRGPGQERRQAAVRRIDDERGAAVRARAGLHGRGAEVAVHVVDDLILRIGDRFLERRDRLFLRIHRLVAEGRRPFERRVGQVRPVALKIWVAVGRARHRVGALGEETSA